MPPRRRLRQESFQDDEAAEDNSGTSPPRSVVQRTQSFSPSPQSYRPLNMSGFGGRPSPGSSNAGGANRFHVTLKIANKRGLVKVKMQSASGNTFSEPLNKVMREMEDDNGCRTCFFNNAQKWWSNMRSDAVMSTLRLTSTPTTFIPVAIAAFDASTYCSGVTIENLDGSRLLEDDVADIDMSQFDEAQLIPNTDPRPTSDTVNNQLFKMMKILGMVAQAVGIPAEMIEAELAETSQ